MDNAQPVGTLNYDASVAEGKALLARLSLADKVIGLAAAAGLVSTFLRAMQVSANMTGTMEVVESVSVFGDWRGKLGFLCFATALVLLFLTVRKGVGATSRNLTYALLAAAGLPLVLAIWLMASISSSLGQMPPEMTGDLIKINTCIGCYAFLLCGLASAAGAALKAMELKLIPARLVPPAAAA